MRIRQKESLRTNGTTANTNGNCANTDCVSARRADYGEEELNRLREMRIATANRRNF